MPLAPDTFRAARGYRPAAVEALLREHYPMVSRLAYGLCGHAKAARAAAQLVMARSLQLLPAWQDETEAANWFLHHTVLASRAAAAKAPTSAAAGDILVPAGDEPLAGYRAFVRALRGLPSQQREAFLLQYGEQLDPRRLAVAMDCSTAAAANHLAAANRALSALAGPAFGELWVAVARHYRALTPPDDLVVSGVRPQVRRHLRRRFFRRWVVRPILAALVIAAAVGAYALWRRLEF